MESLPAAWSISVDISFDYEVSVCMTVTRTLCGFNPGVLKQLSGCLLEVQASADCKWSPDLPTRSFLSSSFSFLGCCDSYNSFLQSLYVVTLPKDSSDPWVSWTDEETGRNINYRMEGPWRSYLRRIRMDKRGGGRKLKPLGAGCKGLGMELGQLPRFLLSRAEVLWFPFINF